MDRFSYKESLREQVLKVITKKWITTRELAIKLGFKPATISFYSSTPRKILEVMINEGLIERSGTGKFLWRLKQVGEGEPRPKTNKDRLEKRKQDLLDSLEDGEWKNYNKLAMELGVDKTNFSSPSTLINIAIRGLIKEGRLEFKRDEKNPFQGKYGAKYMRLKPLSRILIEDYKENTRESEEATDSIPHNVSVNESTTDDERLFTALREYIQSKKSEMLSNHETLKHEKEYFEKLCKEYKTEIDRLESELANKKFKLW